MATIDLGKIKQVFRGTYNNATAYAVDDLVVFTDTNITSTYICTTASTGNNPSSGGTAHANWAYVAKGVADPIPTQSGQSGKYLTTNGSALSFGTVDTGRKLTYGSWVSISGSGLIEFTSIAATTEFYIEWSVVGGSTNSELGLSIGDTNGYVDSGYHNATGFCGSSSQSEDSATNRFETHGTAGSGQHRTGRMRFINMYGNEWLMEIWYVVDTEHNIYRWSGTKTTSAQLDRLKFFVIGGSNFDQGYMRYVKVED